MTPIKTHLEHTTPPQYLLLQLLPHQLLLLLPQQQVEMQIKMFLEQNH
ncbi:MAG: hypothetical protein ACI8RD_003608 [Bacillariaceae sp.]|jgi:hypothetical protein